ncbi:MFS transporter [Novosphingobium sp. BW1]|uniref:MFS transporter n=1 Tax=Novosphingobium sp. BW1 TaxID=2592621 RepID=UPI0011DECC20|nr:MFS transporter [Novosphingobium sp. BW1]TYC89666.1 MFS transporter [Novosphingobium sp. BW1]
MKQAGGQLAGTQRSVVLGFAIGGAAMMAANQVIAVLVLRFLTDNLAISAGIAATLFALVKIYDGFVDPLAGYASDRARTRWGRRVPFLLAAGLLMPLSIVGIFAAPSWESQPLLLVWIGVMLALHGTAFSLYTVPSTAMIVEVSDDYHARSSILAWKTYGSFVGQILGSSVPSWLLESWGADRAGHAAMGWVLAGLIGALALGSIPLLLRARATNAEANHPGRFTDQLRIAWGNQPFRIMVFVHIVFMVGVATASVSNAYFTRYVLARSDAWLGLFYVFLTAGNILALPAWLRISRRFDKKNAYIAALAIYGLAVLSWALAGPQETIIVLGIRTTVIGAAMSGVVLLAASMLTDAVRYDFICSGQRREGAFSGFMSFVDKISNAGGLMIMGATLTAMGYAASSTGAAQAQSTSAVFAIRICFAIIPALAPLLSIFLLRGYNLTEPDLVETVAETPLAAQDVGLDSEGTAAAAAG